jgi:aspartyl-tRNA(Asn)/glutamyl-tRNA(Gln) amidotransferase subunit A
MTTDLLAYCPATPLRETAEGVLAGKTLLIRPDISVYGWLTDAGSRALEGFHAVFDATVGKRLKAAGALFAGSARMAELGFGVNGDTMAAFLSADRNSAGLMTDILGEARMAACAAGCWGFKPSWGLLSRFGLVGLVPSMECIGILAPGPAHIAEMLRVMAGPDENDVSMSADPPPDFTHRVLPAGKPLRIGVPRECRTHLAPEAAAAFAKALDALAASGFETIEASLPGFNLFAPVHQVIAATEASSAAGKYDGVRYGIRAEGAGNWNEMYLTTRARSFGPRIKALLFQGAYFQFQNYSTFENACTLRRRLTDETNTLFGQIDLIAMPVRNAGPDPFNAETVEDTYAAFGLTLAASLAGLPALQIPGMSINGAADFGLQLIGPPMADAGVLAAGMKLSIPTQGAF